MKRDQLIRHNGCAGLEDIREAAGASLAIDAAALYFRDKGFAAAFDRAVIDYLPLRQRITLPPLMRFLGRMNRDRQVPWPPMRLVKEIVRRSKRVEEAKAKARSVPLPPVDFDFLDEVCPRCGGTAWRGATDGPYGICMGCGYENGGNPPYA